MLDRRFSGTRLGLVALTALLCIVGLVAACARAGAGSAYGLYVGDAPDGRALLPLDPDTLADRPDGARLELGSALWGWAFSADGSTAVGVTYPDGRGLVTKPTVVVRDARTGTERARFEAPAANVKASPSRDGRRLLLEWRWAGWNAEHHEWYLVDAADGRVLGEGRADESAAWTWPDPDLRRLYHVAMPMYGPERTGPGPTRIVAHDLESGAGVGRIDLPDVLGGWWPGDRVIRGERVARYLTPGAALSPDGRRIALVDAASDRLTLVDAERLAVERTLVPSRGEPLWDWLPFVARAAFAKFAEGEGHAAVFGADGRRLYVWGFESAVAEQDEPIQRGRGLLAIDLARGTVLASALAGAQIAQVLPAPDGRALYVLTMERAAPDTAPDQIPYLLRRLDADTLAVEAERALAGYRRVVLLPSKPAR